MDLNEYSYRVNMLVREMDEMRKLISYYRTTDEEQLSEYYRQCKVNECRFKLDQMHDDLLRLKSQYRYS